MLITLIIGTLVVPLGETADEYLVSLLFLIVQLDMSDWVEKPSDTANSALRQRL
jgi:hypothetical protein